MTSEKDKSKSIPMFEIRFGANKEDDSHSPLSPTSAYKVALDDGDDEKLLKNFCDLQFSPKAIGERMAQFSSVKQFKSEFRSSKTNTTTSSSSSTVQMEKSGDVSSSLARTLEDWEKTVQGMKEELFQSKPFVPSPLEENKIERRKEEEGKKDKSPTVTLKENEEEKSSMFPIDIDCEGYDPNSIKVRVKNRCLIIELQSSDKVRKEMMTKTYKLTDDVDESLITCYLQMNGILRLDTKNDSISVEKKRISNISDLTSMLNATTRIDENNKRRLCFQYDVSDYEDDNISVLISERTLKVKALKCLEDNRTKEFYREFILPSNIDADDIRYCIYQGQLIVEATIIEKVEESSHLLLVDGNDSKENKKSEEEKEEIGRVRMDLTHNMESKKSSENDGRMLKLKFDVGNYKPEEISVKCIGNILKVTANRAESTTEENLIDFSRSCVLPDGVDISLLDCTLNEEGILNIELPLPEIQLTADHMDRIEK
ncbi:hypothetical protein SNEBB_010175 [Seison nebaliae]|nr:hypothetical protein SNEBB_010175 [Seison nebaliae]